MQVPDRKDKIIIQHSKENNVLVDYVFERQHVIVDYVFETDGTSKQASKQALYLKRVTQLRGGSRILRRGVQIYLGGFVFLFSPKFS